MKSHRTRSAGRRGVASVEFALTVPIAFLLFFGAFEFSRMNMVRHTMDIAAYEGAREGIVSGATSNDVRTRVNALLSAAAVSHSNVSVTPSTIDHTTREITVDVEVPLAANSWITPRFLSGMRLRATSTLAREGFTGG